MKKSFLLLLLFPFLCFLFFTTIVVNAQTGAKTKMIGGGIVYSSTKYDYTPQSSYNSLSLIPTLGYFVKDNLAIGLQVGYHWNGSDIGPSQSSRRNGLGFGPFIRYYVPTSNSNFAVYAQFSTSINLGKQKDQNGSNSFEANYRDIDAGIAPGFVYFFNQHWAVELQLEGVSYSNNDPNTDADNDTRRSFLIGLNSLSPSTIGFRYHF
ncbi:MAG: outer membrane beta-barrel protein [Bacteroidota bacterium]